MPVLDPVITTRSPAGEGIWSGVQRAMTEGLVWRFSTSAFLRSFFFKTEVPAKVTKSDFKFGYGFLKR